MKIGKLITFEGIDGCGKSTQLRLLEQNLLERGVSVLSTREPGGTELGRKIRSALLDGGKGSVEPLAELLLYAADRAQHAREIIIPALTEGSVVLSDRFYDATTVYQGYARGFDLKLVNQLNQLAAGGLKPDLTLLFDLDAETGLKRTKQRGDQSFQGAAAQGGAPNRIDQEPVEFHEHVRKAYLEIAACEPERFRVIPAAGPPEVVFALMIGEVQGLLI